MTKDSDNMAKIAAFQAADDAWFECLTRHFGNNAGEARYDRRGRGVDGSPLRKLWLARMEAQAAVLGYVSPAVDTAVTHRTTIVSTLEVSAEMLKAHLGIPPDARVFFTVPGGGDWSNIDVDISVEHPIHVIWSKTVEEN